VLDETSNWSGFRQADGGSAWTLEQSRTANAVNEISSIANTTGPTWAQPSYDAAGNMITVPTPTEALSWSNLSVDQWANLTVDQWANLPVDAVALTTLTATYDAWNRLVKLTDGSNTVQENAYDARNYRTVRKDYTNGGLAETRHFYYTDEWQVLEERLGSSSTPDRQFVWGNRYLDDLLLRDRTTTSTLDERLYACQDANWNVTTLVDDSGIVKERYEFDPYGVTTVLSSSFTARSASSFAWETTYAGYRADSNTALYAVRNRLYQPRLGTWLTRDPYAFLKETPLYVYVDSSPITLLDTFGLDAAVYITGYLKPGDAGSHATVYSEITVPGKSGAPTPALLTTSMYGQGVGYNHDWEGAIRGVRSDIQIKIEIGKPLPKGQGIRYFKGDSESVKRLLKHIDANTEGSLDDTLKEATSNPDRLQHLTGTDEFEIYRFPVPACQTYAKSLISQYADTPQDQLFEEPSIAPSELLRQSPKPLLFPHKPLPGRPMAQSGKPLSGSYEPLNPGDNRSLCPVMMQPGSDFQGSHLKGGRRIYYR